MITVEEAKEIVKTHSRPLPPAVIALTNASNTILAADIFSGIDMPSFPQSAMDGYAFCFEDFEAGRPLQIEGEIPAGSNTVSSLKKNSAVRIFTGAPVPPRADTVVMQEQTERKEDKLFILQSKIVAGTNVRLQGSDIKKGALALERGALLTPGAIGFLAGLGITEVSIYPAPRVSIIVTGKELTQPGQTLEYGKVYESNSFTLQAALKQLHIDSVSVKCVDDNINLLVDAINEALQKTDILLITGGVSVGDYDFVLPALSKCGVSTLFHKVKQRPGKPLYFGQTQDQLVFGLPGNPSSVLTCFYEYVLIALQQLMNRTKPWLQELSLPIATDFAKPAGLTHFLKGNYTNSEVKPLTAQESYRLSSFALANCLIKVPEEITELKKGDAVNVHILPY